METFTIDLVWVLDMLRPYIEVLVGAAAGWIMIRVQAYTGITMEAHHRLALHSALMTGINAALASVDGKLTKNTKSEVLFRASAYMEVAVPDAIRYFKLTPDQLDILLQAKLQERTE